MATKKIVIRGAKEHNLKNIDLEIPRDSLVVITGLSGSGKSSLAFDTIYAEGQRRYVESLSAYARQFLEQMEKPDVESIEGLSPAISIEQKKVSKNPRSTVGTVTEIYDYLRLLFARVGKPHCYKCGKEITSQTLQQITDQILALPRGSRIIVMAPIARGKKGEYKRELMMLRKDGFVRVKVDGEMRELEEDIVLDKNKKHDIDVVVDRLILKDGIRNRLVDSLEIASSLSDGLIRIEVDGKNEIIFSEKFSCIDCGISYPEISPRMFSFNNPHGACPKCDGLGTMMFFDPDLIVPNKELSIREGAILPWANRHSFFFLQILDALSEHYKFDIYTPFKDLPKNVQHVLLYGSGDEEIRFYFETEGKKKFYYKPFEGVIPYLERRYNESDSYDIREDIERYMNKTPCPECGGTRLRKESLFIKIEGKSIADIVSFSIEEAYQFFNQLHFKGKDEIVA
ncbi:MAG: excinuclease ABC subunit UvrA, partial [Thermotogae bacterium]